VIPFSLLINAEITRMSVMLFPESSRKKVSSLFGRAAFQPFAEPFQ